ncbi:hypothetical protein ACOMHN_004512 [Nucella lapillus]
MCGRTACTLAPDDIVRACSFRSRRGERGKPVWKDPPGGQQYHPCHNIAPTAHTPVLLSSKHYPGELEAFSERVVQPMKWGLVPSWHKGDPYRLEYETNNCRAEGMLTKRTYRTVLDKGRRCVVLADGFFEWKRSAEGKQPYFIYFPQKSSDTPPDIKPDASLQTHPPVKPDLKTEVKPDPSKLDCKASVRAQLKQEPKDIKPGSTKLECKSSVSPRVKQEPLDVKLDPLKPDCKSSQIKQEPVDVKPDPDAFLDSASKDRNMMKDDFDAEKGQEKRSGQGQGHCGVVAKGTEHDADGDNEEWQGKHLLTMAGVFDVWHPPDGSPPLYSYSVITVEASPAMAGIHHRMPAILTTEEELTAWLDFAEVPLAQAVKAIHSTDAISLHMVSPVVNNSRNKSPECVQVYNPKQVKKTASSMLMMNWLKKAAPAPDTHQPSAKKQKLS